jgi:hypothetical protein
MKTTIKRIVGSRWPVHAEPSDALLRELAEAVWEKRPMHVGRGRVPLMSSAELFQTVVRMADAFRRGEPTPEPGFRWCHDGKQIVRFVQGARPSAAKGLPRAEDGSFAGYHERLSGLPSYFLQAPHLQAGDALVWQRCQSFLTRLYGYVGVPSQRAFCDVYVGRYQSTPFGIHIDGASNFTFGIEGKKTLYLWEPEFYHAKLAHLVDVDYRRFLRHAIALTVGPGEVIYWPSRYWHIAEPSTELSVTMNIAYYGTFSAESHGQRAVERAVQARLAARRIELGEAEFGSVACGLSAKESRCVPHGLRSSTDSRGDLRIPEALTRAVDSVERDLPAQLRDDVTRAWVGHMTRLGFDHPPPMSEHDGALAPGTRLGRTSEAPIHLAQLRSGKLLCSANGRTMEVAERAWVRPLLRELNVRSSVRVGDHPTAARALLRALRRWGALELAPG